MGDEENEKENEDTKTKEIEKNTDEEEDKETRKKKCRRKHKTTYDPDEIMTFSEDEEEEEEEEKEETNSEDDSDIDDDGLVAYDMDEDEEEIEEEKADFERGKRRPVYARECIARARESGDNIDELSIALEQLRKILEDDPDDAEEYANEAMGLALDIHPPAGTGGLRRDILILAAINAPRQAARFLTGAFYESGRSVGDRALVLDVVVECAHRLSDIKSAKGSVVHTSPNSGTSLLDAELIPMKKEGQLGNGELVAGQTRRWHTIRTGTLPATGQNKFLRVAGDFFYPLVQQGARKGAGNAVTADLLGEDGYILGLLLETLCVIVECSVGHVGHIRMCETLLRFAGELRYHVDSSVRRGAYRCVWVVAGIGCSSKVLAGSIAECLVDWRDALCVTATEDPDPDCRALACAAITRLKTLADTTLGNTAITYEDLN